MKRSLDDESSELSASPKKRKIDENDEENEDSDIIMSDNGSDAISELWDNGYDEPDYRASLIYAIHSKQNWQKKVFDAAILKKWKKEAIKQKMPSDQFDSAIDILIQMMQKDKEFAKLKKILIIRATVTLRLVKMRLRIRRFMALFKYLRVNALAMTLARN